MWKLMPIVFFVGCGGKATPGADVTQATVIDVATIEVQAPSEDPRKLQLTRANARLTAGRKAFDERDYPKAMMEAQRGLDMLGADYAPANVADDSAAKLALAKERAEVSPSDGATVYLRMLGDRIELAKKHWNTVP